MSRRASKSGKSPSKAIPYLIFTVNYDIMGTEQGRNPMWQTAGISVAMGNAPQEVKDGATVVTKTNNENGAGQAVETYVLI